MVSYAIDTYVIVSSDDLERTKELTESVLSTHASYLYNLGMVVNESKTEIMWLGSQAGSDTIMVAGTPCKTVSSMKVLGQVDSNMTWDDHLL